MTTWTGEKQARVAEMLVQGATFKDIAHHFQTSRSAIAGMIFRDRFLRTLTRPHGLKHAAVPRKPPVKKAPPPPAAASKPQPQPPLMRRVGLLELGRADCRWAVEEDATVIGSQLFCGAPTIDTYCEYHAALAYAGKGKGYDG